MASAGATLYDASRNGQGSVPAPGTLPEPRVPVDVVWRGRPALAYVSLRKSKGKMPLLRAALAAVIRANYHFFSRPPEKPPPRPLHSATHGSILVR